MKVLLLCMALAAISLAMPVAEDKSDASAAPAPVAVTKSEDTKSQAEAQPAATESKEPEKKNVEKAPETEAKNAPAEPAESKQPEAPKPEAVPEDKKNEPQSESNSAAPADAKADTNQSAESKSEEKRDEPLPTPAASEEPKSASPQATIKELTNEPSAKSVLPDENIDIINAVKTPAAVADDVVDPAAIIPTPEKKIDLPVIAGKSAEPVAEEKKDQAVATTSSPAQSDDSKIAEVKKDEKTAEVAPTSVPAGAPKPAGTAAAPSEDSLRVVRDTVDDKAKQTATEESKVDSKAPEPVKPAEIPQESVSDNKGEAAQDSKLADPVKTNPADKEAQPAPAEATDAVKSGESKPDLAKADEKPAADAPAPKESSEESVESSETKDDNPEKDSSEESSEKSGKKESSAPK